MEIQNYDQLDQNLLNQKRIQNIQTTNQTQVTRPSTDDVKCEVMDFYWMYSHYTNNSYPSSPPPAVESRHLAILIHLHHQITSVT